MSDVLIAPPARCTCGAWELPRNVNLGRARRRGSAAAATDIDLLKSETWIVLLDCPHCGKRHHAMVAATVGEAERIG